MTQKHILFVGNPGAGKSTLLNCHAGELAFKSGVSYGGGLTSQLDKMVVNGVEYLDTPGLADQQLRKEAAKAISDALKKGGEYQIVFVLLNVNGRVRPDDQTTMKLVLDSCPEMENKFGIIVNQCKKRFVKDMEANPVDKKSGVGVRDQFEAILFSGVKDRQTPFKLYLKEEEDLDSEDDTRMDIQELMDFMELVPSINLTPNKAADVNSDSWAEVQAENEKYKKMLEENVEELKKARDEQAKLNEKLEQQMIKQQELNSEVGRLKEEQDKAQQDAEHAKKLAREAQEAQEVTQKKMAEQEKKAEETKKEMHEKVKKLDEEAARAKEAADEAVKKGEAMQAKLKEEQEQAEKEKNTMREQMRELAEQQERDRKEAQRRQEEQARQAEEAAAQQAAAQAQLQKLYEQIEEQKRAAEQAAKGCQIRQTSNSSGCSTANCHKGRKTCGHCGLQFCIYHSKVNNDDGLFSFGGHVCRPCR